MTEQNRRAVHRVHFVQAAALQVDGEELPVRLLDISLMGALVELEAPVEAAIGDRYGVTLTLGPDVVLELDGEVVRMTDDGNQLGISWDSMSVDSASHLHRLLELNLGDHDLIEQDIEAMYVAHVNRI